VWETESSCVCIMALTPSFVPLLLILPSECVCGGGRGSVGVGERECVCVCVCNSASTFVCASVDHGSTWMCVCV